MVRACMAGCRVLVLGGTGHVGRSMALALSELRPDLNIVGGGRNREKGTSLVSKLGGERSEFVQVDIHNASRLKAVMEDVDLVIHAAGPFQRDDKCTVLQAAISSKTAYTDVCDGMDYSWRAKSLHDQAKASGVPALITAGISPGVSNVMAAELVWAAESKNGAPERLRFFYYIAGTGDAGPTALGTSFSLLGEDVIAYNKGQEIRLKPYSGARNIHFGKGIGRKDVYLMVPRWYRDKKLCPRNILKKAYHRYSPSLFVQEIATILIAQIQELTGGEERTQIVECANC